MNTPSPFLLGIYSPNRLIFETSCLPHLVKGSPPGANPSTSADDPEANASAQRDRSLDNDAETGLGALPATGAVTRKKGPADPVIT